MIAATASRQYVMLCAQMHEVGGLRIEMFEQRMNGLQVQLAPVGIAFDQLGQRYGIDFEDLWQVAAALIIDESRFVLFSGREQMQQLEHRWEAWLISLIKRIDDKRPQTYRCIDAGIQIGMAREFIELQSAIRAWIVRMSVCLYARLFIDVPRRLRAGDVGSACRVSANALSSAADAIRSPLSTINTVRVY